MSDNLKEKENDIAKAVGKQMELQLMKQVKIQETQKEVAEQKIKLLSFYDFDRFQSTFLDDAALLFSGGSSD